MSLITPTVLRSHVETDLSDAALQRVIDATELDVAAHGGVMVGNVTERVDGGGEFLVLSQAASAIVSIAETIGGTTTVLVGSDYESWNGGWQFRRLNTGTNQRTTWGDRVLVTYSPVVDTARREMTIINLCKLDLQFNGLVQESAGGYNMTIGDYEKKRRELLSRVRRGLPIQ